MQPACFKERLLENGRRFPIYFVTACLNRAFEFRLIYLAIVPLYLLAKAGDVV
ncbi:hypothetical protein D1AOALGA4SA_6860 [Olavius algarvensis Delta 1 endosymbiont]|nr:hypothetical protein D1AOALGA4SA_6860 [Olavius algarvensis Delta 1 endosymbiont]